MLETTREILRAIILTDTTLAVSERKALSEFVSHGTIRIDVVDLPLMLSATRAAQMLGFSVDTFKRVRDQAAERGVRDLCGVEVTPGNVMFSKAVLIRFSMGEYGLDWPGLHDAADAASADDAVLRKAS